MAYNVKILPSASAELENIIEYLKLFSYNAAERFISDYEDKLILLQKGTLTQSLSRMPELAELGYHAAIFNKYCFLYYIENNDLVIAHFFHQRQNYAKLASGN